MKEGDPARGRPSIESRVDSRVADYSFFGSIFAIQQLVNLLMYSGVSS
jgi:hypothetical protein